MIIYTFRPYVKNIKYINWYTVYDLYKFTTLQDKIEYN